MIEQNRNKQRETAEAGSGVQNCEHVMRLDFSSHGEGTIQYKCLKCGAKEQRPILRYEKVGQVKVDRKNIL